MPTYEYKCLDCGIQFDRFQSITEDPIQECPECSGRTKRLIGAGAGLIFKGSGFYITDYRSEGYKESAKKDKDSSSSSDGADSKSGDSKSGDSKSSDSKSTKTESGNASKSTSDTSA
jgi:putative FmdB family regulatory protein